MNAIDLYALDQLAVESLLVEWGFPREQVRPLWRALYRHAARDLAALPGLPPGLGARLAATARVPRLRLLATQETADEETRKDLLALEDGARVEVVLLRYGRRRTACLSTQVGCACGCAFCATGQQGFTRQLTTAEILAQALHVRRELLAQGEDLTHVVLMGMGEPLLNTEAVFPAVARLTDPRAVGLSPRRVTLSTVGIAPGLSAFIDAGLECNLALSLHAATDALRDRLVPVNGRYPLGTLLPLLRRYAAVTGRRLFVEWALIGGVNDTPAQAEALVGLLAGLDVHVNLIPLNATPGSRWSPPLPEAVATLTAHLDAAGIPHTLRRRGGDEIAAGCGQLRGEAP